MESNFSMTTLIDDTVQLKRYIKENAVCQAAIRNKSTSFKNNYQSHVDYVQYYQTIHGYFGNPIDLKNAARPLVKLNSRNRISIKQFSKRLA